MAIVAYGYGIDQISGGTRLVDLATIEFVVNEVEIEVEGMYAVTVELPPAVVIEDPQPEVEIE